MTRMKSILILSAVALLSACGQSTDLGPGKTGKSFTVSNKSYDQVWGASLKSVKEVSGDQKLEIEKNLSVTKEDKAAGVIQASTGMSLLSWGEVVGIYISPQHDAAEYKIEVESLTKLKTNVFAHNWEDEIIGSIQKNLLNTK